MIKVVAIMTCFPLQPNLHPQASQMNTLVSLTLIILPTPINLHGPVEINIDIPILRAP